MDESLVLADEITEIALEEYKNGVSSLQDLLQIVMRRAGTEIKLLESYIGYKRAYLSLLVQTYFDYERGKPVEEAWMD